MFADYFIIRRTRLRLSHLYVPDQSSIYWYTHGLSSFLALPRPGAEVYRASSYMAPLFFFFVRSQFPSPCRLGALGLPFSAWIRLHAQQGQAQHPDRLGSCELSCLGARCVTLDTPTLRLWLNRLSPPFASRLPSFLLRLGFSIAFTLWTLINKLYPPPGLGEVDETDVFGTFDEADSNSSREDLEDIESKKMADEPAVTVLGR
jgi:hypothetical protein